MWVKTFIQALQECQNTKMKKIHLGNQKFPPSTGRPNCQNQAVWPACVRWELVIPQMNFFHFGVLAFLQGLYKCFHQNFPSNFFFTLCILQTYSELYLTVFNVLGQWTHKGLSQQVSFVNCGSSLFIHPSFIIFWPYNPIIHAKTNHFYLHEHLLHAMPHIKQSQLHLFYLHYFGFMCMYCSRLWLPKSQFITVLSVVLRKH